MKKAQQKAPMKKTTFTGTIEEIMLIRKIPTWCRRDNVLSRILQREFRPGAFNLSMTDKRCFSEKEFARLINFVQAVDKLLP